MTFYCINKIVHCADRECAQCDYCTWKEKEIKTKEEPVVKKSLS